MVAKSQLKFIKSLHQKKYRNRHGLFLAEGIKLVGELLQAGWEPHSLYASQILQGFPNATPISERELKSVSTLVQPNKVLGVFELPIPVPPTWSGWILALDGVRDPGNLGTIIRLCDWFGIRQVLCSPDTVDCFNPKVLMATMGSIARVQLHYQPLETILPESGMSLFGASMEGIPLMDCPLPQEGILVMGSESHGISSGVREGIRQTLSIPSYGGQGQKALMLEPPLRSCSMNCGAGTAEIIRK